MPTNSNLGEIRNIVHKHITEVNGKVDPKGWLAVMVMKDLYFHPNRAQIGLGEILAPLFEDILKLKYIVPQFVAGLGVTEEEAHLEYSQMRSSDTKKKRKGQSQNVSIFTYYDIPELAGFVTKEVHKFKELKKRDKKRTKEQNKQNASLRIDDDYITELTIRAREEIPQNDSLSHILVDLCFIEDSNHIAIELKSTGDEDGPGAVNTLIQRILMPLVIMKDGSRTFFANITNNKGWKQNGEWCGKLGGLLSSNNILVEDNFWKLIAPDDVSFEDFQSIFNTRFDEFMVEFTETHHLWKLIARDGVNFEDFQSRFDDLKTEFIAELTAEFTGDNTKKNRQTAVKKNLKKAVKKNLKKSLKKSLKGMAKKNFQGTV